MSDIIKLRKDLEKTDYCFCISSNNIIITNILKPTFDNVINPIFKFIIKGFKYLKKKILKTMYIFKSCDCGCFFICSMD